jgi:Uma2 family endonuclease
MYQRAGVPWYWIVDMEHRAVRVLRLAGDEYHLELVVNSTRSAILPPFESTEIDLGAVLPPQE